MIIILNKPVGWTSFDVCKKVKSITKEKKVGHGGTLDPFASGVLVIGTGKDTKKLKFVSDEKKSYDATLFLGEITDTLDVEGKVIQKKKVPVLSKKKITKTNCLLVRKLLSFYYKGKIVVKKPNDLLINKKKICGILQETLNKFKKKYLIIGIGVNLIKNPNIRNYPTTNLSKLIDKKISKKDVENKLKKIFELNLSKLDKSRI